MGDSWTHHGGSGWKRPNRWCHPHKHDSTESKHSWSTPVRRVGLIEKQESGHKPNLFHCFGPRPLSGTPFRPGANPHAGSQNLLHTFRFVYFPPAQHSQASSLKLYNSPSNSKPNYTPLPKWFEEGAQAGAGRRASNPRALGLHLFWFDHGTGHVTCLSIQSYP